MNPKGKKSPLTKAQATKTRTKKGKASTTKKIVKAKAKNFKPKEVTAKKSRLKRNAQTSKSKSKSTHPSTKSSSTAKKPQLSFWLAVYAVIVTVGLSTILGTAISLANSLQTSNAVGNSASVDEISIKSQNKARLEKLFNIESLGKENSLLKQRLQKLAQQYPDLEPEIFIVDLDTKSFVSIEGKKAIASASTIKLPILIAFFQDVDRGKINLEEQLTMSKNLIAGGSGNMRYEKVGTKFSALETATRMMTVSDNTATNMLIQRLGGMEQLNQRFASLKLESTRLRNLLPDLTGTNTTSPQDLGNLLVKVDGGELLSLRSRDRLMHIMGNIVNDTLLPQGLEPEALIAHKTGDIKSMLGDVGTIDMPNGKRYIASVLVKRPDNSPQAKELIQKISRQTYQYFQNSQDYSSFSFKPNDLR